MTSGLLFLPLFPPLRVPWVNAILSPAQGSFSSLRCQDSLPVSRWISFQNPPQSLHFWSSPLEGPHLIPLPALPFSDSLNPSPSASFLRLCDAPFSSIPSCEIRAYPLLNSVLSKGFLGRDATAPLPLQPLVSNRRALRESSWLTEWPWPWTVTAPSLLSAQDEGEMPGTRVPNHHVGASAQFDLCPCPKSSSQVASLLGFHCQKPGARHRHVAEEGHQSSCMAQISTNGEGPKQGLKKDCFSFQKNDRGKGRGRWKSKYQAKG